MSDWRERLQQHETREDWLAARPLVTGSKVPTILGLTRKSAFQQWCEDVRIAEREEIDGYASRRGHFMEEFLADELDRETGRMVQPYRSALVMHPTLPWAGYSLDAMTSLLMEDEPAEFKAWSWGRDEWADEGAPEAVIAQVQWGCEVLDLPAGWIAADIGGTLHVRYVERSADWLRDSITVIENYVRCVEEEEPPAEMSGAESETDALNGMHPEDDGSEITLSFDFEAHTRWYVEAEKEEKEAASAMAAIKNRVRRAMKAAQIGNVPGVGRWTWKKQKDGKRPLRFRKDKTK